MDAFSAANNNALIVTRAPPDFQRVVRALLTAETDIGVWETLFAAARTGLSIGPHCLQLTAAMHLNYTFSPIADASLQKAFVRIVRVRAADKRLFQRHLAVDFNDKPLPKAATLKIPEDLLGLFTGDITAETFRTVITQNIAPDARTICEPLGRCIATVQRIASSVVG